MDVDKKFAGEKSADVLDGKMATETENVYSRNGI